MTQNEGAAPDLERFLALGRVETFDVSPDGHWAAVSVARLDEAGGRFVRDLWRVELGTGASHRLTTGDSDDSAPCFRGDGSLGFLSSRRGSAADERRQVWLLPARGGEPRPLTDEPCGVTAFRFAREASVLVALVPVLTGVPRERQRAVAEDRKKRGPTRLRYTRMPVRHWDQWLSEDAERFVAFDGDGGERRELCPEAVHELREAAWCVAADGSFLITTWRRPGTDRLEDTELVGLEVGHTAAPWPVASAPGAEHGSPVLSGDGATVAYTRHQRQPTALGPRELVIQRLDGSGARRLKGVDRWLTPEVFSRDGKSLFATADHQGRAPVYRIDLVAGGVGPLAVEAGGAHTSVRVGAAEQLFALRSTILSPPELAVLEGPAWRRLSSLSGADLAALDEAVVVEELPVERAGRKVQTFVVRPRVLPGRVPALLWVHGGPHTQWTDAWHWRWNAALCAVRGYVVVLPNPAGSTGFGQELVEQAFGNRWGDDAFKDVIAVADALTQLPHVDPSRIAAMGGSFGGYMANWLAVNSLRFACIVTHASVFDLPGFHGTTDHPAWFAHAFGGLDPDRDRELWELHSPRRLADRWRTPTLILHGERDYRVPISEALALFEALDSRGVDAELVVFPDEGHWIQRPRNVVAWYETVLEFLGRRLA